MDTTLPLHSEPRAGAAIHSRTLAAGLGVVLLLAAVKLALHLATTGLFGYGFFIDELYYLACSEHLSWGFVDMPPLFPAITALMRALLGDSLFAVRLLPALSGLGMMNKHTMAFFGVAVVLGLLHTPARRAFRSPWLWLGGLLAVLIYLPNLIWDVQHHFPHFELLANVKADGRDTQLNPLQFMLTQSVIFNPLTLPLWVGGLVWFLIDREGRRWRTLGLAWLAVMGEMFLLDGRIYYPAPAYPMLFAAGGVAIERWIAGRRFVKPAYASLLALSGAVIAPTFVPLLPPETLIRYQQAIGMSQPRIENNKMGPPATISPFDPKARNTAAAAPCATSKSA
jgi:4-amino-4-deoxy-L-arabinose transferase-like glycosyltransferase